MIHDCILSVESLLKGRSVFKLQHHDFIQNQNGLPASSNLIPIYSEGEIIIGSNKSLPA